ncbi:MAG: hypothetical protein Q9196_005484 [Gyalolechia fulgens]
MSSHQAPEVDLPYYFNQSQDVETIFGTGHDAPFLDLPAVVILQNSMDQVQTDQAVPSEQVARQLWTEYTELVKETLRSYNIDVEAGPILPCEDTRSLSLLYDMFNRTLFNSELPPPRETGDHGQHPGLKLGWAYELPNTALGVTHHGPNDVPIELLILKPRERRYLSGSDALLAMSTLLHEMCHVYESLRVCWCQSCGRSRTGHGNAFLFLAWLVENAANQTFPFLGRFDLNRRNSWIQENQAREDALRREHSDNGTNPK